MPIIEIYRVKLDRTHVERLLEAHEAPDAEVRREPIARWQTHGPRPLREPQGAVRTPASMPGRKAGRLTCRPLAGTHQGTGLTAHPLPRTAECACCPRPSESARVDIRSTPSGLDHLIGKLAPDPRRDPDRGRGIELMRGLMDDARRDLRLARGGIAVLRRRIGVLTEANARGQAGGAAV